MAAVVVSHTSGQACMTGMETVMRSGGGLGSCDRDGLVSPGSSDPGGDVPVRTHADGACQMCPITSALWRRKAAQASSRIRRPGPNYPERGWHAHELVCPVAAWKALHAWSSLRSSSPAGHSARKPSTRARATIDLAVRGAAGNGEVVTAPPEGKG